MKGFNRYINLTTFEDVESGFKTIPYLHDYYGTIKAILLGKDVWFFLSDVVYMLGYCCPLKDIIKLIKPENVVEQHFWVFKGQNASNDSGRRQFWIVNLNGIMDLANANADNVDDEVLQWIVKEVVDSIKRCGYLRDHQYW